MTTCKITLDAGLLREFAEHPSVHALKLWQGEGKVEIFEADRASGPAPTQYNWPGASNSPSEGRMGRRNRPQPKRSTSGISFARISAVLFPQMDPQRLNMQQVNSVAHLLNHHIRGHEIFVTGNHAVLISDRRQERLSGLGIFVMTLEETVAQLQQKYGWVLPESSQPTASGKKKDASRKP